MSRPGIARDHEREAHRVRPFYREREWNRNNNADNPKQRPARQEAENDQGRVNSAGFAWHKRPDDRQS